MKKQKNLSPLEIQIKEQQIENIYIISDESDE